MKKIFTLLAAIIITSNLFAQAPQKMSYQAVIRNATNELLVNKPVKMRISILQGSATGSSVYSELHSATTNANGLVSIEIGGGASPTGIFSSINWGNGTYFVKTETDPNNGTNYTITGTSQLLSVPYALESHNAKNADNAKSAGDGIKSVSSTGDTVYLNNGKKYIIPGIKDVSAPATLNNGLVGYWPFNGNANDESGNGNNGTVNGATLTTDRFGVMNKAYSFDGIDDYIYTNYNGVLGNNSRSICAWVKVASFSDFASIFTYGSTTSTNGGSDRYSCLLRNDGTEGVSLDIDGSRITYSYNVTASDWYFYTWVFDNSISNSISDVKIYVDGLLLSSMLENYVPFPTAGLINTIIDENVKFGSTNNTTFLNGKLDDIRIYNRALTQEEITYLANN
jgi:hypothetical protein